ncbi:MAG: ABC transporter ATP-binding protein [Deltaproteobacteria bacterium]|nr:ABC transporter ATP-binding protein [Deltaproteobacteria bacterium]
MPLLSVEHISFSYGREPTLRDVSLAVDPGEIVSLLGPNGSGKTTLLKIMLGLLRPRQGRVRLARADIAHIPVKQFARRIAYVPQTHRMAFAYRVLDVVMMGRLPHKPFLFKYGKQDQELALAALDKLSIAHLSQRPYTSISGGERQLTLIARALAQDAEVFVMDEPANGLDYGNQIRLLEKLNLLAQEGYTFIKTTHFPDHALWVSDRVLMLKKGRVVADENAEKVINEKNLFEIYNSHICVEALPEGGRICMPQTMRDHMAHTCRYHGPPELKCL